jgi:hypothetical protein
MKKILALIVITGLLSIIAACGTASEKPIQPTASAGDQIRYLFTGDEGIRMESV